ncbi:MAG: DUF4079 domain-containing protein [Cyanobacteriota bacterium]|nr:DUF4079 domain-containing protein [Cyanobacteriota bacterium]
MVNSLRAVLEPIAGWFDGLGIPTPIVQWGHPLMMAIVVLVMGSFVGLAGWRGRVLATADGELAQKSLLDHRQLAPWMSLFIGLGYTGGILSLVMQKQPLLESPHFWTGSLVLLLLTINGLVSLTGFMGNRATLRTLHAYLGSLILCILFAHALLGLKLGLALG